MVYNFYKCSELLFKRCIVFADGDPVGLFEDKFLSGFKPLFEMDKPSMKALQKDRVGYTNAAPFLPTDSFSEDKFGLLMARLARLNLFMRCHQEITVNSN